MNESIGMTFYVWWWKLLAFMIVHPWSIILLYLAIGFCVWHYIYTTFFKASEK